MLGYDQLLNETCSYEKYSNNNIYNEKEYHKPIIIKCFKSYNFSNDRVYDEQNISNNQNVFIGNDFEPNPFDKIDGKEIKQIIPVKGLKCPVIGWQIVL